MSAVTPTPPPLGAAVIEPPRGLAPLDLREVWAYRELLYFFAWRDVKVRYRQTALGAAWAILQPAATMIVFTIFFGRIAGIATGGPPYPLFSYVALLPWLFFAQSVGQSSQSLVSAQNMLKRVYFPRMVLPLAAMGAALVDFAVAFVVLLGLMAWYGVMPPATVVWLPVFLLLALVTAAGTGLWLAAINVRFRDVRYIVPFFTQLWMFITPVIYPSHAVLELFARFGIPSWVYGLNPLAAVVEGSRWALLGSGAEVGSLAIAGSTVAVALLVSGAYYFRSMEESFADIV